MLFILMTVTPFVIYFVAEKLYLSTIARKWAREASYHSNLPLDVSPEVIFLDSHIRIVLRGAGEKELYKVVGNSLYKVTEEGYVFCAVNPKVTPKIQDWR